MAQHSKQQEGARGVTPVRGVTWNARPRPKRERHAPLANAAVPRFASADQDPALVRIALLVLIILTALAALASAVQPHR